MGSGSGVTNSSGVGSGVLVIKSLKSDFGSWPFIWKWLWEFIVYMMLALLDMIENLCQHPHKKEKAKKKKKTIFAITTATESLLVFIYNYELQKKHF
jgi:hypothetical protein